MARQINFNRTVDRRNIGVAPNHAGIVDVGDIEHGNLWVIIDEIIQPPRAHHKTTNDFAGVGFLHASVDDAAFNQIDNPIGKHFGVNAQIFVGS